MQFHNLKAVHFALMMDSMKSLLYAERPTSFKVNDECITREGRRNEKKNVPI